MSVCVRPSVYVCVCVPVCVGSLEEQEFFGEVLFGIKQVIQTHMKEIQVKFQDEFFNMELEVKKRDDIISKLQNRILELEGEQQQQQLQGEYGRLQVQLPPEHRQSGSSGSGSTGSSNELPFMVSSRPSLAGSPSF